MATTAQRKTNDSSPVVRVDGYAPIAEYAAIGDGRTVGLVARDGSIDWLPLPTIDQSSGFGALLDAQRRGHFRLAPVERAQVTRRYIPGTNVLETTFSTEAGTLRLTDALTLDEGNLLPWVELVRKVECLDGAVPLRFEIEPRFGYGLEETTVSEIAGHPLALGERIRMLVLTLGSWRA